VPTTAETLMAYFRISELPDAAAPVAATSLIEISSPDNTTVSGYDSHKITITNLFTDISLGGNIFVPTYPPGTNNGLVASTQYVDRAVNNTISYVDGNFLKLTGGTLSGDLHAPKVYVTAEYWFQDRGGSEQWALYTQGGIMRLWQGDDRLTLTNGGYLTAKDFRSEGNVYAPAGYGYFETHVQTNGYGAFGTFVEAWGDIKTHQSFYTYSSGDAGGSTDWGFFSGRRWRFKQAGGDDAAAGSIDYRGYDAGALSIVGAGGSARNVKIYDNLFVTGAIDVTGTAWLHGAIDVTGTTFLNDVYVRSGHFLQLNNASGSSNLRLYDDSNSHIESTTKLWLNFNGNAVATRGRFQFQDPGGITDLIVYNDSNSHIESGTKLWINTGGQPTEFGGQVTIVENEPLLLYAPNGQNARILATVGGTRTWSFGCRSDGNWGVGDESAGALRFYIDTAGTAVFNGRMAIYSGIGSSTTTFPLTIEAANDGTSAFVHMNVIGVRRWASGVAQSAQYLIVDYTAGANRLMIDASGSCFNGSGSWFSLSDASLKENIKPYSRGLEAITQLNCVQFQYSAGTPFATENDPSPLQYGLVADQVFPHIPEVCGETDVDVKGENRTVGTLRPGDLVYVLINAIKTLDQRLSAVEAGEPAAKPD